MATAVSGEFQTHSEFFGVGLFWNQFFIQGTSFLL